MRIIDCVQGSDEWDNWRARPTASEFGSIVTPARGDYSKQATAYAAKIVAKRMGVYVEPPPSFWMTWGIEQEPYAKRSYTAKTGHAIVDVGFVLPNGTDAYGGSPDGLVADNGLVEVKCPAPETLIAYHAAGKLPDQYKPQIQGLLMITKRLWCDFWCWHPHVAPFHLRVDADEAYQAKIASGLLKLLQEIKRIEEKLLPIEGMI